MPTSALFVLRPRLEGSVLVMQEKLSFGIRLPSYEFQDSHGNITWRSMFMPDRNDIFTTMHSSPFLVCPTIREKLSTIFVLNRSIRGAILFDRCQSGIQLWRDGYESEHLTAHGR